jgi:uncharacterized protein
MMVNRTHALLIALCFCLGAQSFGQPSKAERTLFEETKAKAEQGDAEAQLALAGLYASGTGVSKDPRKAEKWHRMAAEHGLARAQYELALDCFDGIGTKPDPAEAVRWLRLASEQGLVEARMELGQRYLRGDEVRENAMEAVKLFRLVAAQGTPAAEAALGTCYLEGTGVPKDILEGVRWTRQAAEKGFPLAQNTLGRCCEKGIGVPMDLVEAYKWYSLAAAQDDERAPDIRVSLARVEAKLSPDQIAQAQHLAREFKPQSPTIPGVPAALALPDPAVKTGFVRVQANDDACEVYADGAFVGNSPARLKLTAGPHSIEVRRPGFKSYQRQITVGAQSDLNLRAKLDPL